MRITGLTKFILTNTYEEDSITIPILHLRKLRGAEISNRLPPLPSLKEVVRLDLNLGSLTLVLDFKCYTTQCPI